MKDSPKSGVASTGPRARYEAMKGWERGLVLFSALLAVGILFLTAVAAIDPKWTTLVGAVVAAIVAWNVAEYAAWRADQREDRSREERARRTSIIFLHLLLPIFENSTRVEIKRRSDVTRVLLGNLTEKYFALESEDKWAVVFHAVRELLDDPLEKHPADHEAELGAAVRRCISIIDYKLILELPPSVAQPVVEVWGDLIEFEGLWRQVFAGCPMDSNELSPQGSALFRLIGRANQAIEALAKTVPDLDAYARFVRIKKDPKVEIALKALGMKYFLLRDGFDDGLAILSVGKGARIRNTHERLKSLYIWGPDGKPATLDVHDILRKHTGG